MTRTTTARTIKRDTCKEAGKKGRKNKNNIGDEEKETQEKEKKQEEGKKKTRTRRDRTQRRRKTTGRKNKTKLKKEKRNDKGESETEAPTKNNKHNQQEHRKIDQNHDPKIKYLLHKKSSIIKMIERDLLSRREKARNIKQLSLSS